MFYRSLIVVLLIVVTSSAETTVLGSGSAALERAVREALPGEVLVIHVSDNEVYLDVTRQKGAAVGRKYAIERSGEEIRHPTTGDLLGHVAIPVAEVEITWVQEGFSRARVLSVKEGNAIRVKDTARSAVSPIVVRLPLRHQDGSFSRLTETIDAEINAAISRVSGVTQKTGPAISASSEAAANFATLVPEAAVAVGGRIVGDKVEISVVNVPASTVAANISARISEECAALGSEKISASATPVASSSAPVSSSPAPERTDHAGEISIPLDYVPIDMTTADLDGDGTEELILVDNRTLRVSRLSLDGTLKEVAKLPVGWAAAIFSITAVDMDRDGKDEIYVTEKPGNYVRATGYRYTNGKLERFWKASGMFLRGLREPEGDVLYGQEYGTSRPFTRNIVRYRYNGTTLESVSSGLPSAMTVYDFARLGATGYVASIDYENKIRLYNHAGEGVWASGESYGGSDYRLESADRRNAAELRIGLDAADLDGDGTIELVAVQNLLEGGLGGFVRLAAIQQYKNGRIVVLDLKGISLEERWKTKTYSGIIRGFTVANPLGRGPEAVFFSLERFSFRDKRVTLRSIPLR